MDNNRRKFLKIAGVAAAIGMGGGVPLKALGSYEPYIKKYSETPDKLHARRWGMVIDTRKFKSEHDFEKVIEACHTVHNVPDIDSKQEIKWIWTDHYHGVFPGTENPYIAKDVEHREYLLLCNHCENPPCVRVCPTKATFKRESDGIVLMDFHRCIGCRYCMAGCPYGARSFNFMDPRPHITTEQNREFPTRSKGVVEKCNFCAERLAEGLMPACVVTANEEVAQGAMVFGDLEDSKSEIRKVLAENFTIRRKPELGTEPSVFYII